VFILVGAPYVERISAEPRVASAARGNIRRRSSGSSARWRCCSRAVVLLPQGFRGGLDWVAVAIAGVVWLLSQRTRLDLPWILRRCRGLPVSCVK
jgi:hypothetical protein